MGQTKPVTIYKFITKESIEAEAAKKAAMTEREFDAFDLDFRNRHDLQVYLGAQKFHNVAWRMYAKHTFKQAGLYTFCLYNYYSAELWMGKKVVVDNSGAHGNREKCTKEYVDAKTYG